MLPPTSDYAHIKKLQEEGVPEAQAAAIVNLVRELHAIDFSELGTKSDLEKFQLRIDVKITQLDSKIDSKTMQLDSKIDTTSAQTKAEIAKGTENIVKWLLLILVIQVLMPVAQNILPLLFKLH